MGGGGGKKADADAAAARDPEPSPAFQGPPVDIKPGCGIIVELFIKSAHGGVFTIRTGPSSRDVTSNITIQGFFFRLGGSMCRFLNSFCVPKGLTPSRFVKTRKHVRNEERKKKTPLQDAPPVAGVTRRGGGSGDGSATMKGPMHRCVLRGETPIPLFLSPSVDVQLVPMATRRPWRVARRRCCRRRHHRCDVQKNTPVHTAAGGGRGKYIFYFTVPPGRWGSFSR